MSDRFSKLLSPIDIGTMRLKNRMVMSPMTTAYCNDDQTPSERLIGHFEARARGGVGLITLELVTVDVKHPYMHRSMTLGEDRFIDKHRRLVEAVHQHGAKVQPQISHTGPESVALMFGGDQPVGPSVAVAPVWGWHSRELKADELADIAIQYGEAARRAREAGYDGIELHAAHCYNLLGSFLSPLRNKRTDDYSAFRLETRTRFMVEVLEQISARAGVDFPVTLSISGYERAPGGRSLDDTQAIAPTLVEAGVKCFRVSGGISDALVTQMVSRTEAGPALNAANAESIRNVVNVPVMAVGRIHDPDLAESIIRNGQADLVAMARPLLADPELPNKVASGRTGDIRPCISCEGCIDSMQTHDDLRCAVNPLSGREHSLASMPAPTASPFHLVVIGGGPAGMEAARQAAASGYRVTLVEQQRHLGGSLLLASTVHAANEAFLDYLKSQMNRLPIQLQLGTPASVESISQLVPDAVIVATGAKIATSAIPGMNSPGVMTGAQLRQRMLDAPAFVQALLRPRWLRATSKLWMPIGKRVAIVGADLAAVELAEFLAHRKRRVHLLDSGTKIAPEVGKKRRAEHMDRLDRLQVTVNTRVDIERIKSSGIVILSGNGTRRELFTDTVLVTGEPIPDTSLCEAIRGAGFRVKAIGDCCGVGLIAGATRDAAEAITGLGQNHW
ncbi:FAD-dependent oxidoreductase [Candidatus Marimicrobium litorale]|uniref:FAD-dependent oxidoreductase n=1 Tax=Candidatus Marimicrobium litorale TaxID=2518991 RepID=A0ABT3T369_9GAMM|nr:FAD-dependent oxidoreductase [Candidatus Marimicrobium litorale]MCX2976688.1 FAD-dependent oxidoreductase [Candidatus Marimicrobium litorale]